MKTNSNAEALTPHPTPDELPDRALEHISGGAFSGFINWGDVKGGSTDDKHKDW